MKILKPGRDPKKYPKKVTCLKCKTEFEYDKEDTKLDNSGDRRYVMCPVCGRYITDVVYM